MALLITLYLMLGFVSRDEKLKTPALFESATMLNSGWLGFKKHQSIRISLPETVALQDVVDLSVFGHLRPGMDHSDAVAAEGPPEKEVRDSQGQVWYVFRLSDVEVQVGCPCIGSGDWLETCAWRLRAQLPNGRVSDFLGADALALLEGGRWQQREVGYREIMIIGKNGERLDIVLDKDNGQLPSVSWQTSQKQHRYGHCAAALRRPENENAR